MSRITTIVAAILVSTMAFAATGNTLAGHASHDRHTTSGAHVGVKTGHGDHRGHGSHKRRHYYDGHRHGYYRHDCHKVSKHGYYHGRKAKIGGTMCYDRYGDPYIVQGSRYVIHYY